MDRDFFNRPKEATRTVKQIGGINLFSRYLDMAARYGKPGPLADSARQISEEIVFGDANLKVDILADIRAENPRIEIFLNDEEANPLRTLYLAEGKMDYSEFDPSGANSLDDIGVNMLFVRVLRDVSRKLSEKEVEQV